MYGAPLLNLNRFTSNHVSSMFEYESTVGKNSSTFKNNMLVRQCKRRLYGIRFVATYITYFVLQLHCYRRRLVHQQSTLVTVFPLSFEHKKKADTGDKRLASNLSRAVQKT